MVIKSAFKTKVDESFKLECSQFQEAMQMDVINFIFIFIFTLSFCHFSHSQFFIIANKQK